jgi:catechol 2,3-dioxygenase-like lactoylglutathione lyase family enzyme
MRLTGWRLALLVTGLLVPAACGAAESSQYWSGVTAAAPIGERTALRFAVSSRWDDDMDRHYYTLLDAGLDRKVGEALTLGAYYAHVNSGGAGAWRVEYRPHVDATVRLRLGSVTMSDRGRVEFRIRDGEHGLRFRNRLKAATASLGVIDARPYASIEPFIDLREGELNACRTSVGCSFAIRKPFALDLYYMYESRKAHGVWSGAPVFGSTLAARF